jgi:glutathione S-transferase
MKLYGTLTSPFVRRVRFVADALGVPFTLVDTSTDAGQAALRAVTPFWKVPTAALDGQVIFDSRAITEHLLRTRGHGPLRPMSAHGWVQESNLIQLTDGVLETAIRFFYLRREGADLSAPYLVKEAQRIDSTMAWLAAQVDGPYLTDDPRFGAAELVLYSTLDWMRFRRAYPVEQHPSLVGFLAAHAERMAGTAPPG